MSVLPLPTPQAAVGTLLKRGPLLVARIAQLGLKAAAHLEPLALVQRGEPARRVGAVAAEGATALDTEGRISSGLSGMISEVQLSEKAIARVYGKPSRSTCETSRGCRRALPRRPPHSPP